jgi:hypothetical protein
MERISSEPMVATVQPHEVVARHRPKLKKYRLKNGLMEEETESALG